jgi:glucose-6-phosphate 1-dehydrogenase
MAQNNKDSNAVESAFLQTCDVPLYDLYMEPFAIVIFGGTGDLSAKKLLPTLYRLRQEKKFSGDFCILAVARKEMTDDEYRLATQKILQESVHESLDKQGLKEFCSRLFYLSADVSQDDTYKKLCMRINQICGEMKVDSLVYYLAVPPRAVQPIIERLSQHNLCRSEARPKIIIEKPFGRDKTSAAALNQFILKHFDENQVYRIDHYLGKETVQNILFFRFGNSVFEPLWNRRYIDHVQITVAEDIGIENRGVFYEQAGFVRDIIQNHMMQLLALVAMEPPVGFEADLIRDEKVKVFRAVRPMDDGYIDKFTVRGQYGTGKVAGESVRAYREEEKVAPDSNTPTFFAAKFYIDSWRWAGVPFYVRAGKRLAQRVTEIYVHYKQPPLRLFGRTCDIIEPNSLILSIQPREELSLRLNVKRPGVGNQPYTINMDFNYAESFEIKTRPAYERLLLDSLKGDLTLFARADGVEAMWNVVDPIIARWESIPSKDFPNYEAGSWGPKESDELLEREGRSWKNI